MYTVIHNTLGPLEMDAQRSQKLASITQKDACLSISFLPESQQVRGYATQCIQALSTRKPVHNG